jgi:TrmH family RNA methyltransferase
VQDPGNLGTIIRIADWFGIDTIYCSEDTADAYNPKVVQATMGSLAHVHIIYTDLLQLFDKLPKDFPVYGTLLDGNDIYQQPLSEHGIIVMGNEGNGISEAVRQRVTHRLLIPNFHQGPSAESLNVAIATAITCSEFRRRGTK